MSLGRLLFSKFDEPSQFHKGIPRSARLDLRGADADLRVLIAETSTFIGGDVAETGILIERDKLRILPGQFDSSMRVYVTNKHKNIVWHLQGFR